MFIYIFDIFHGTLPISVKKYLQRVFLIVLVVSPPLTLSSLGKSSKPVMEVVSSTLNPSSVVHLKVDETSATYW